MPTTRHHTLRLQPGSDLRGSLEAYLALHQIRAAAVLTCVGSLTQACLRLADESLPPPCPGPFEIVSLVGTLGQGGVHLHLAVADRSGSVRGGHLRLGSVVHTTAEIALLEWTDRTFLRPADAATGFAELQVAAPQPQATTAIVLYDGSCGLCHRAVTWLLRRDVHARLRFAPLQGSTAAQLRGGYPQLPATVTALAAVVDGRLWLGAPAVFAVLRLLPPPWSYAATLRFVPGLLTNAVYRLVARWRHRLGGRRDSCQLPPPAKPGRLLP